MTRKTTPPDLEELSFESIMAELEKIASNLDSGQMPLQAAMEAFEKGMKLCRKGEDILARAERVVEMYKDASSGETTRL